MGKEPCCNVCWNCYDPVNCFKCKSNLSTLFYFTSSKKTCLMFVSKSVTDINGVLQIRNLMAVLLIRKAEFDATHLEYVMWDAYC